MRFPIYIVICKIEVQDAKSCLNFKLKLKWLEKSLNKLLGLESEQAYIGGIIMLS